MPVLASHRFSVEEYYRMAETGVLKPDERVELLDGCILDMLPIGRFHGKTTKRLIRMFGQLSQSRWMMCPQDPVHLDARRSGRYLAGAGSRGKAAGLWPRRHSRGLDCQLERKDARSLPRAAFFRLRLHEGDARRRTRRPAGLSRCGNHRGGIVGVKSLKELGPPVEAGMFFLAR